MTERRGADLVPQRVEAEAENGRPQAPAAMVEALVARQAQEVQAAMIMAKRFPRDEVAAFQRIMTACKRKSLAEQAMYAYPRGNQTVTGPSIRLAEALARAWGNIDFGIVELEQREKESTVMAYAWDLETNSRQVRVFDVPHRRYTRNGSYPLTDPRDVYELIANQGARRLRACILGIIPGDVQDAAIAECEKTLAGGKEPLIDRVRSAVTAFAELGVTQEMIEQRLGHKLEATIEPELVMLRKVFQSIKDGAGKREDFFGAPPSPGSGPVSGNDLAGAGAAKSAEPKPAAPPDAKPAATPPSADEIAALEYQEFADRFGQALGAAKGDADFQALAADLVRDRDWLGEERYAKQAARLEEARRTFRATVPPPAARRRPRADDV